MSGWIKIYREIQDHWIFENDAYFKAWFTILSEVNISPATSLIKGELIFCDRAQALYSIETWAKMFGKGWTNKKVKTFFNLLKKDSMIVTEGLSKTTMLTVCNYETYQGQGPTLGPTEGQQSGQHLGQQRANSRATIKEERSKEVKKEENISINFSFESFRKKYPGSKRGYQTEFDSFRKKHKDHDQVLELLDSALESQILYREKLTEASKVNPKTFIPAWKNLGTWLYQRCWEDEMPEVKVIDTRTEYQKEMDAQNEIHKRIQEKRKLRNG